MPQDPTLRDLIDYLADIGSGVYGDPQTLPDASPVKPILREFWNRFTNPVSGKERKRESPARRWSGCAPIGEWPAEMFEHELHEGQ